MIPNEPDILDFEIRLLQEIAEGNQIAYKKLYDRYRTKIYSLAFSVLKNQEDSEDILSEVFVSLWNNRTKLVAIDNINAFIYTVTKNRSLNLFKKKHTQQQKKQQLINENFFEELSETSEAVLHFKETQALILSLTDKLPQQQRQVFNLIKIQGYKRKEVAEQLNLSENTIRNHLNAAIKAVKKEFEKNYPHLLSVLLWLILR